MLINSWEKNTGEMNFIRVKIFSHCPNNPANLVSDPKIIYKKDKEQYVNNFYNQML